MVMCRNGIVSFSTRRFGGNLRHVNKTPGAGDFTSVQAAIDSGATTITITDSGTYKEDVTIGDPSAGAQP